MGVWTLRMKFDGDEKEYSAGILEDATIKECVGAKGKHAMQSCSVSIMDRVLAAMVFNSTKDIDAKICNGDTVMFEGVIRPYAKLSAEMAHENPIELEVIDYTQVLHCYVYTDLSDIKSVSQSVKDKCIQTFTASDISVPDLIEKLFALTGITDKVSLVMPEMESRKQYFVLEAGSYIDEVIEDLLYEYCLDYRFSPGTLTVYSTKVVNADSTPIAASQSISDFNLSFTVKREDVSEDGVSISYGDYRTGRYKIYSESNRWDAGWWTTGGSKLSGYYYNRGMHKTLDDYTSKVPWSFPSDLNGKTVVSVSNVEAKGKLSDETGVSWSAYCTEYDKDGGKPYIKYSGWFDYWFGTGWGWKLEVYANVFYRDSSLKYEKLLGLNPTKITSEYIETSNDALLLCANVQARNERSAYKYEFSTRTSLVPGSIVRISEDKVTGLETDVRITSRTYNPLTLLYSYEAEGAGTVSIPVIFSGYNATSTPDEEDSDPHLISLSSSRSSFIVEEEDTDFTVTASGLLFSPLGCTPIWSLNGETQSEDGLAITLKKSLLKMGANTVKCSTAYDGQTYESSITIPLVQAITMQKMLNQYGLSYSIDDEPTSWSYDEPYKPDNMVLWQRIVVTYSDGSTEYLTPTVVSALGDDLLKFSISRLSVDFYADGVPSDDTELSMEASSTYYAVKISIDGEVVKQMNTTTSDRYSTDGILTYAIKPSVLLKDKESVKVVAYTFNDSITYTIRKNTLVGTLTVTADKTTMPFYADNFPHDESDKIVLSVTSENYKNSPKLYIDNALQETEDSASYTFDVPQSMLADKPSLAIKVSAGSDFNMITLAKTFDIGSIDLTSDKASIGYYADNVAHNDTELATFAITQSGYRNMPTLYIDGVETEYASSNGEGTYQIPASQWRLKQSITARIAICNESKSATVAKALDSPAITLSLSEAVAEYYHDNVAITGDITATVGYSGLYYAPLLRIGDTPIALSDEGTGTIPISLFDSVDSGLTATAYAQKNIIYSTSVSVPKQKRPLVLSLGSSGSQFSYNSEGTASPASITLTNNTQGLSDKGKATLVVGGELKAWADGAFTVTPDMITGRYLAATISYGNDSSTMIITKTYDGKAETVEYSKTKSFKIYPDEEYEFTYSDTGLSYNGETMAWVVPWGTTQPDISSNEYLWRRSRNSDTEEWQYTRLTGIKGDDGKAGEYLGHYLEAPTAKPDGSDINDGDYYLNTSEAGSPLPYIYKDGQWTLVTADNPMWSQIASATIGDVNNYGGSLLSTSAYYGYFQALSAQKAFIKSLGTQEITLSEGGAIQSESYGTSGGAEGFRIGADGNVDFNSGIWRGSFANGLSFIPPTNVTIKKTMTQKEAYQALKKAGVAPGVYKVATASSVLNTGTYIKDATLDDYSNSTATPALRTGNGFTCLDYDHLDMQIPLATAFNGIIPLDSKYMIGITIEEKTTSDGTSSTTTTQIGAYLFTKSMAAKAQWNATADSTSELRESINMTLLMSHPLSDWAGRLPNISGSFHGVYGTVVNGKIILWEYLASSADGFGLYEVNEETMDLALVGNLSLPEGCYLTRWLYPAFYYHEKADASGNKYWETSAWDDNDNENIHYKLLKTTDLLAYTVEKDITTPGVFGDGSPIAMDIVLVNGRVFAQVFQSKSGTNGLKRFAEYNETEHTWDTIPNEETVHMVKDDENTDLSFYLPSLVVRGNVIYGTYSTHEFFSYDTATSTYKDLSDVFRTCLSYMDYNASTQDAKIMPTSPPTYAYIEDIEEEETTSGELTGYIGTCDNQTSYSATASFAPDYIILKYNNTYEALEKKLSSTNIYVYKNELRRASIEVNLSDSTLDAHFMKPYSGYTISLYSASSFSTTTNENGGWEVKTNGIGKTTTTITNIGSYTEKKTTTATRRFSPNMEWNNLYITALGWSDSLSAIVINVECIGEDIFTPVYASLAYDPETGKATSLSPQVMGINFIQEFGLLPICQFAESDGGYVAIAGSTILASSASNEDRMSFTMNNIRLEDLFPYINDSVANPATGIFFPDPSSVPMIYRKFVEYYAPATAVALGDKDKWEYDGERMFRTDLETLNVNCIVPFFKQEKMIVRETNEYYEIFLGSPLWSQLLATCGLPSFPTMWGKSLNLDTTLASFFAYYSFGIAPNSNIYPILRIDKDSEEPVGATFIWDFPAQLTTGEDIKTVALSDFFNSRLAIGSKI